MIWCPWFLKLNTHTPTCTHTQTHTNSNSSCGRIQNQDDFSNSASKSSSFFPFSLLFLISFRFSFLSHLIRCFAFGFRDRVSSDILTWTISNSSDRRKCTRRRSKAPRSATNFKDNLKMILPCAFLDVYKIDLVCRLCRQAHGNLIYIKKVSFLALHRKYNFSLNSTGE